jgi:hypothetical protein
LIDAPTTEECQVIRTRPTLPAFLVALVVLSGCQLAFDAPGQTAQIVKVDESASEGWRFEYFENREYPCSQPNLDGSTGYQTFVIGSRDADDASVTRPLWVFLRGGGSGWVDPDGTAYQNGTNMREESFEDVRGRLLQSGLMARIRNHPDGFRMLAVSMCNRDTYGGSNNPDPNNFTAEGTQRVTNGLLATKAAISFATARASTSDFFLHGGSAGSAGTYHVAYALETMGNPPAGIVADGGIRNDAWELARIEQGTCASPYGGPEWEAKFAPRVHSVLRAPSSQPHELVASGELTVPIVQLWNRGDGTTCRATPMVCPTADGPVDLDASDCKNEPLRAVIEAQGADSRSLALGVCVTSANSTIPCDIHVTSNRNLPNSDPDHPADYISTIVDWVDARLAEP